MHKDTLECTLLTDKAEVSLDLECSAEVLHILCSSAISSYKTLRRNENVFFFFITITLSHPKFLSKHIIRFGVAVYSKLFLLMKNQ